MKPTGEGNKVRSVLNKRKRDKIHAHTHVIHTHPLPSPSVFFPLSLTIPPSAYPASQSSVNLLCHLLCRTCSRLRNRATGNGVKVGQREGEVDNCHATAQTRQILSLGKRWGGFEVRPSLSPSLCLPACRLQPRNPDGCQGVRRTGGSWPRWPLSPPASD